MRVLITYGTKLGGTAGIAETIGHRLEEHGFETTVAPAQELVPPDAFDAVIIGGALYATRWIKESRRYIKKFAPLLRQKPVWLFSSGPLDDSALGGLAPAPQVQDAMEQIGARGHATFGGRLEPDAKGILAGSMAKQMAGDWRDDDHITSWSAEIATALGQTEAA